MYLTISSYSSSVVVCPSLLKPDKGYVTTTKANLAGSIATYGCNSGFIYGSQIRMCQSIGEWSGIDPQCIGTCEKATYSAHTVYIQLYYS